MHIKQLPPKHMNYSDIKYTNAMIIVDIFNMIFIGILATALSGTVPLVFPWRMLFWNTILIF